MEIHTSDGRTAVSPCRRCEECRKDWSKRWIGRLTAEAASSKAVWFVTLTYGGGDEINAAHVLDYRDVQAFFKRLRNRGYRLSYTVVGEYGSQGHRAHWHALVYWTTDPPEWPLEVRTGLEEYRTRTGFIPNDEAGACWPHGFLQAETPRSKHAAASYILKYLEKPGVEKTFRYSRGKAIGATWCETWARRAARAGGPLWPKHRFAYFTVDGNQRTAPTKEEAKRGFRGPFPLYEYALDRDSVLVEYMARAYMDEWGRCHPGRRPPKLHPHLEEVADRLNDHWNVSPGERAFLALLELEDPGSRLEVGKYFESETLPGLPGLVLMTDRANGARRLEFYDEEGRKLWQTDATEDDAATARSGDKAILPERLRPVVEARARREAWKRELLERETGQGSWQPPPGSRSRPSSEEKDGIAWADPSARSPSYRGRTRSSVGTKRRKSQH